MSSVKNTSICAVLDLDVVRLLVSPDPEHLEQLIRKHGHRVRRQLRTEFAGLLEARDLDAAFHEGAYQAFCHACADGEDKGDVAVWFYLVARNAALALVRRDRRRPLRPGLVVDEFAVEHGIALGHSQASLAAAAADAEVEAVQSERRDRYIECLRGCIKQLPRLQRKVIQADLASPDVADATQLATRLRTTKNSIYVSRSMARKSLKREMQRHGFFRDREEKRA